MKITIIGKPRSTNNIYKTLCRGNFPTRYLSAEGKALKEDYQWQAKSQWHNGILTGPIKVTIHTYHDNCRKNDWDNFHKLSMDALTGIVYLDDSQIEEATVIKGIDRAIPRIEIEIEEIKASWG